MFALCMISPRWAGRGGAAVSRDRRVEGWSRACAQFRGSWWWPTRSAWVVGPRTAMTSTRYSRELGRCCLQLVPRCLPVCAGRVVSGELLFAEHDVAVEEVRRDGDLGLGR
jgi:hypothetical protein